MYIYYKFRFFFRVSIDSRNSLETRYRFSAFESLNCISMTLFLMLSNRISDYIERSGCLTREKVNKLPRAALEQLVRVRQLHGARLMARKSVYRRN